MNSAPRQSETRRSETEVSNRSLQSDTGEAPADRQVGVASGDVV